MSIKPIDAEAVTVVSEPTPRAVLERAGEMARALLQVVEKTRDLQVQIGGRRYLRVEAWLTIAAFHGVSVAIDAVEKSDSGYVARASVLGRDGRVISRAEASCSRDEPTWKDRPDFALRSMAQTRATAKALRLVYSYIPVLAGFEATPAEEVEHLEQPPAPPQAQPRRGPAKPAPPPEDTRPREQKPSALQRFRAALSEAGWPEDKARDLWAPLWPAAQRWRDLTPQRQELLAEAAPHLIRLIRDHGLDGARHLIQELLAPPDLITAKDIADLAQGASILEPEQGTAGEVGNEH